MRTLAIALFMPAVVLAQIPFTNPDFEARGTLGQVPPGWGMSSSVANAGYRAALVNQGCVQGQQCAMLTGPASAPGGSFGYLGQFLPPAPYRSTHVIFRGAVKVDSNSAPAQIYFRVDKVGGGYSFFKNTGNLTSTGWGYYTIEADVPADTLDIAFGFLITGAGTVWVDDVSLTVTGWLRQDASEAPRPLTDAGLANVTAFARLAGFVRYFHPSDQSSQLDWETFLINGVRAVEDAGSPGELAQRLQALFDPIAPTVRVFVTGTDPEVAPDLHPESVEGLSVIRWFHAGLGIATTNAMYQSKRIAASIENGQFPQGYRHPDDTYNDELGGGVTARVPTVLYADANGTLPHRDSVASTDRWIRTANDRATRLAGVIITWNVFRHFYPYFDYIQADMPAELRKALPAAAQNQGSDDFAITLRRLVAAIKDGHGSVSYAATIYTVPLVWAWTQGQLIVTRDKSATPVLQPGDRILTIDGEPVETVLAEMEELEAGATPQWIRLKAVKEIARCQSGTTQMRLEVEPYAAPGTTLPVQLTCRAADYDWTEPRPNTVSELEPGIMYVDIGRLTALAFAAAIPKLEAATGIIFDFRGYPQIWPPSFIQHLTRTPIRSEQFYVPTPTLPDQTEMTYDYGYWSLPPLDPYFSARRVFLIDASAISQAETDMDLVEHYRLADFVGEPTAGTTGDVNPFPLPGGFQIVWTDLRVLKPGGEQFYGVGIRPTIPVSRTRQGIAEGVDEILQSGLAAVKGQ
jgi:hypothetical protein